MVKVFVAVFVALAAVSAPAHAAVTDETAYVLNTLLFLIGGFLVMWMAAGFCMLEAGLVRSKNVATMCLKNIVLFALAGLMYLLVGYRLMYDGVDGGFLGSFGPFLPADGTLDGADADFSAGYASSADWFFQMVFVATAASIVSGTLAERVRLTGFFVFVIVLTGLIYPIQGAWTWGSGLLTSDRFVALAGAGFSDFAGSTLVHSAGGWAALTGAIVLGPRLGRYDPRGRVRPMPGSNLPLATLGTFILWLGWFGFNGGSQLAMGSGADVAAIARIFANTNMAAVGGTLGAMLLAQLRYKKIDLTFVLNGALAGLVSITAAPLTPSPLAAVAIGAVGGVLVVVCVPLFDRLRIDDVVGALSVHLVPGIWGTLAVPLTNPEATLAAQGLGVLATGLWVSVTSLVVWLGLKATIGLRLTPEDELAGGDTSELGMEAYPEFGRGSQFAG
ncbi:ammonium transporter [Rhodothalassium salexigens DSM 2132]|uniref:Ammonium transporter n=1 Tax=Rhodothalassium salexigens DSM 2132 TaxID=1188247 RepID=A0A4R2PAN9_RHOSA|nr:ammonium transporter [Rhodothalassium salexigens]MBB4212512.1 Amt family ammonium transporter [Rhodothalassium salexigens DSM 2132]MBK1638481.1 ammonium transporter [Rhodothalassium salexigens DSM 2132]TCP31448.1 ammonium transporter [Rhodothalassium salexigens DSM 2132]